MSRRKQYTSVEMLMVSQYLKEGMGYQEIANLMNRSRGGLRSHIWYFSDGEGPEEYIRKVEDSISVRRNADVLRSIDERLDDMDQRMDRLYQASLGQGEQGDAQTREYILGVLEQKLDLFESEVRTQVTAFGNELCKVKTERKAIREIAEKSRSIHFEDLEKVKAQVLKESKKTKRFTYAMGAMYGLSMLSMLLYGVLTHMLSQ